MKQFRQWMCAAILICGTVLTSCTYEDNPAPSPADEVEEQLRKMIGFRFARHPAYNLPAERLKAIEKALQNRVQVFLNIPDHE